MKKIALLMILVFTFSFSVLAEGEIPIGGRSCPNGQQSCLIETENSEIPVYQNISKIWKFIFG